MNRSDRIDLDSICSNCGYKRRSHEPLAYYSELYGGYIPAESCPNYRERISCNIDSNLEAPTVFKPIIIINNFDD